MIIKIENPQKWNFCKKSCSVQEGHALTGKSHFWGFSIIMITTNFFFLFYFWKTNILKKSLEFYLDFENLSFLTNFEFSRGVYRGSNLIFEQNKNYPQYQCISDHIFRGVLYEICKNNQISPPPYSYNLSPTRVRHVIRLTHAKRHTGRRMRIEYLRWQQRE